jgi:hypothetical protein
MLAAPLRNVGSIVGRIDRSVDPSHSLFQQPAKARLYLHGVDQPCLIVNDLKLDPRDGGVALWVGPGTEGYFSNVKITAK